MSIREVVTLNVKREHPMAIMPKYAKEGDAAFDLSAIVDNTHKVIVITPGKSCVFDTGLVFDIPEGFKLTVLGRSGNGIVKGVRLSNCTGLIDGNYRGTVKVGLHNDSDTFFEVNHGDRIAQAFLERVVVAAIYEVSEVSQTNRGSDGLGSTGSAVL